MLLKLMMIGLRMALRMPLEYLGDGPRINIASLETLGHEEGETGDGIEGGGRTRSEGSVMPFSLRFGGTLDT